MPSSRIHLIPHFLALATLTTIGAAQTMVVKIVETGINARVTHSASYGLNGPVPPTVPVNTQIGTVVVGDDIIGNRDTLQINGGAVATSGVNGAGVIADHAADTVSIAWIENGILNVVTISYQQISSTPQYV